MTVLGTPYVLADGGLVECRPVLPPNVGEEECPYGGGTGTTSGAGE